MVLAIGSQLADLGDEDGPDEGDIDQLPHDLTQLQIPEPAHNPGWRFYEVSKRLLPDIICSSSMTSVQVCLLQGLYLPSTGRRDAGYNLLGLALRMSINMGLHKLIRSSSLRAHVCELRNRLWWSVYIAERLYSIDMGRPLSINDTEITAPYPVHMPEWGEEGAKAVYVDGTVAMAKLCRVLGKIIEPVYCDSNSFRSVTIRPGVLQKLRHELEQWRSSVPASVTFDETCPTRPSAHLFMTYEQANILLTRPCLHMAAIMRQANRTFGNEASALLGRRPSAV
ncbi:C6 transcription factor [Fusarium albosuccineum]|uniref:C6 transcription factor n=1 Tax=Fusarium albosuccineum TaxID=1237068 RepID=A0A8H4L7D5_9HYPO|nr:C6 transcription factor [Fusarium albosuccineum]